MKLPMSMDDFHRVPRHPDWKWEYWDGAAQLSYRPRTIELTLDTAAAVRVTRQHDVRLVDTTRDQERLRTFLADVWRTEDPCRTFDEQTTDEWLRYGLDTSFTRLDEPAGILVEAGAELVGAVVTERPYPRDEIQVLCLGWLTVRSGYRCDGVATAMLAAVVEVLRTAGVQQLRSGVSVGNRPSLYWHWRNGFQAVSDPMAGASPAARHRR